MESLEISMLGIPLYLVGGTSPPRTMKLLGMNIGTRKFTTLYNEASRYAGMIDSGTSYNFVTIPCKKFDLPTLDTPDLLMYQGYGYQMPKGCARE